MPGAKRGCAGSTCSTRQLRQMRSSPAAVPLATSPLGRNSAQSTSACATAAPKMAASPCHSGIPSTSLGARPHQRRCALPCVMKSCARACGERLGAHLTPKTLLSVMCPSKSRGAGCTPALTSKSGRSRRQSHTHTDCGALQPTVASSFPSAEKPTAATRFTLPCTSLDSSCKLCTSHTHTNGRPPSSRSAVCPVAAIVL
ncbi:hypothetical protein T492DRAFT_1085997, partial [Pavlovales sp. CCMP2436]